MEGCRKELEAKLAQGNPDLDIVDMLTKGESNLLKTDTEDGEGEAKNEDLDAEDTKVEVEEEQNSLMSSLEEQMSIVSSTDERGSPPCSPEPGDSGGSSSGPGLLVPGLVVRRGSACRVLHPLPTIVQPEHIEPVEGRRYIRKAPGVPLTEEETALNEQVFKETIANEFPDEDMLDKTFRDKDKDWVIKTWILRVLEEEAMTSESKSKQQSRLQQSEELVFMIQSGVLLCKLAAKIVPNTDIDLEKLQSGNLMTKRKNISIFLKAAAHYGVPLHLLFQPDDLAVQAHVYKVTRTLFVFAELTNLDPDYNGPSFNFDTIIRELIDQGLRRKSSVHDVTKVSTNINTIFANLMQDVERRSSLTPKGPPANIYYCD